MPLTTMKETFLHELEDAYDAEHQFLEAQRAMASKAVEPTLVKGIKRHIGETEQQIKVLQQVFKLLGEPAKRVPCDGAKGLVSESQKVMEEAQVDEIRDSLIGGAASKAESYEVNAYTGMVASAELMGQPKVAALLQKNLRQEERMQAALERREEPLLKRALKATGELATANGAKKKR
jgi:ferritin-like metal-binding protein YciE